MSTMVTGSGPSPLRRAAAANSTITALWLTVLGRQMEHR